MCFRRVAREYCGEYFAKFVILKEELGMFEKDLFESNTEKIPHKSSRDIKGNRVKFCVLLLRGFKHHGIGHCIES